MLRTPGLGAPAEADQKEDDEQDACRADDETRPRDEEEQDDPEDDEPDSGADHGFGMPAPGSSQTQSWRTTTRSSVSSWTAYAGPSRVLPESLTPPYGIWSLRNVGASLTITPPNSSR